MVDSGNAVAAISQALFERDEARKSRDLAWAEKEHQGQALRSAIQNLSDQRDALREQVEKMKGVLSSYAEDFCEYSLGFEGCGRLGKDACSGCYARAVLTTLEQEGK